MITLTKVTPADIKQTPPAPEEMLKKANDTMAFIKLNFPQVITCLPAVMEPFDTGYGKGRGMCTHPGLIEDKWLADDGCVYFLVADLPDGFHCAGIQNRGSSESLFVLWVKGDRKFWFYDRFISFAGKGSPSSTSKTRKRLRKELNKHG